MNPLASQTLALPEPAWHTADLRTDEAKSEFWHFLRGVSDEQLVDLLQLQERWFQFHHGHNWSLGFEYGHQSQLFPVGEQLERWNRADYVRSQIKREIVERFTREVETKKAKQLAARKYKSFQRKQSAKTKLTSMGRKAA